MNISRYHKPTERGALLRSKVYRLQVTGLLRLLGITFRSSSSRTTEDRWRGVGKGIFWQRHESSLPEILQRARDAWKRLITEHHPDRGGDPARAAQINAAWQRVQKLFRQRGITLSA